jgi:hypothetical protein
MDKDTHEVNRNGNGSKQFFINNILFQIAKTAKTFIVRKPHQSFIQQYLVNRRYTSVVNVSFTITTGNVVTFVPKLDYYVGLIYLGLFRAIDKST